MLHLFREEVSDMNELLLRRRVASTKSLPYDAEIEYLEATGTQYIDTLFYPRIADTDITVENKFNKSVRNGDHCVLGARTSRLGTSGFKLPNFYNDKLEYQGIVVAGEFLGSYTTGVDYTVYIELKQGSQKFYVNGVLNKQEYSTGYCNAFGNLYMFALNDPNATVWFFNGKIYYCKIWQDDILERDFIPVRVGSTGYMYDKVSGILFGNAGTGSFILGPDK